MESCLVLMLLGLVSINILVSQPKSLMCSVTLYDSVVRHPTFRLYLLLSRYEIRTDLILSGVGGRQ